METSLLHCARIKSANNETETGYGISRAGIRDTLETEGDAAVSKVRYESGHEFLVGSTYLA